MTHRDKPRETALAILRSVEEGAFADAFIEQARRSFGARDSAFILEIVYGTLRNRALLDFALNQFSAQPVEKTDAATRNILRLGAYQLLFMDRVPASAAVNTSTELAKAFGRKQGYVNGLLRNFDRKRKEIAWPGPENPIRRLSVLHSHPEWLVGRWVQRFGDAAAEALLRANNMRAPLVIRTNTLKTSRDELKASLAAYGAETREVRYSPVGLEIVSSPALRSLPAYEQGLFLVQDQAAQLISQMLDPQPGDSVLDACAAPGGKATHLAELMQNRGEVIALENEPGRIAKIRENSERLGISIIASTLGDAMTYGEGRFDKVLIDAPCSGLGVLRRRPDGRWIKDERTIRERAAIQRRILDNCSKLLKPGGALVYATCTTEPEENEDVLAAFLSMPGSGFVIDDPRPHLPEQTRNLVDKTGLFRTYPQATEMDGFFGVRMIKSGAKRQ